MEKEILFLKPEIKKTIWGGSRLSTEFHYCEDREGIGECWGISAHPHGDCLIRGGRFDGIHLSELYKTHKELFGEYHAPEYPLLVKIIDAEKKLSIQVHPDDVYAKEHENGSLGKTECWYIMDCPEGAELVIGHHAKTRQELAEMIGRDEYEKLIGRVPVKKGDFIQIVPGTVHAITEGLLILETQQNSDITYRVYDYNRTVDGKLRPLHVQQSIDVINVPDERNTADILHTSEWEKNRLGELISCDFYRVWKLETQVSFVLEEKGPFVQLSILEGEGTIDGNAVKKGDHMIIPCGYGDARIDGNMTIILSVPV